MSAHIGALAAVGCMPAPSLAPDGWDERFDAVVTHGLAGLLAEAWRGDQVELGDETLDRLDAQLVAEARRAVLLEAELLRLAPVLDRYRAVVLKGAALAHGAYPDPSWRPFTDLDVLVGAADLPAVVARLEALGYTRPRPDPSVAFLVRIAKATALVHPCGLVIDLHRTLVAGNLGEGIDVDALRRERIVVAAGAVPVPAPNWTHHLVEVALHAVVGDGLARAITLRDVVQVAAHPAVEPAAVVALADQWRVASAVAVGLEVAHEALGVPLPAPFATWVTTAGRPAPLLEPGPSARRSARIRLDELRHGSLRRRVTLLRALVVPDPAFLRWRYGPAPRRSLYARRWRDLRDRRVDSQFDSPAGRGVDG